MPASFMSMPTGLPLTDIRREGTWPPCWQPRMSRRSWKDWMRIRGGRHRRESRPLSRVGAPCDFQTMPPDAEMLAYWLNGTRKQRPATYRKASPIAWVTSDDPPGFFFHGSEDWLVPSFIPKRMDRRLREAGVASEYYECTNRGHIRAFLDRPANRSAADFLDRLYQTHVARSRTR